MSLSKGEEVGGRELWGQEGFALGVYITII